MEFLQPQTWAEALQLKAAYPDAVPIQGGTDVMVELNFDRYRPEHLIDLTRVRELAEWAPADGRIWLGAGVTYTRVQTELGGWLPGLAMASRTVGLAADPQPGHGRRQPGGRVPSGGFAPPAAGRRRAGGGRVGARHPAGPGG